MMPTTTWSSSTGLRALTPDRPVIRGTAQNPDTFFQAREASQSRSTEACPGHLQGGHGPAGARLTGRQLPPVRLLRAIRRPSAWWS